MEKKWRRIGKGEMLPTSSIIRPIDGGLPNIAGSRVMVGQDCYYLSVDDAYELLKGLSLETEAEAKGRNEATIIKKLIGLVKETEFLSVENRASLLDWLEKQGDKGVIKYVRKDVFIEKAAEWLANNVTCDGYTFQSKAKMIREFKKAMEL